MYKCILNRQEVDGRRYFSVNSLVSVEDVATMLETFEQALREIPDSRYIKDVVEDKEKFYYFVTLEEPLGKFDFYTFLNSSYKGTTVITPINAKLMFPDSKSRGIYNTDFEITSEESDTSNFDNDEDVATGFIDEDELDDIVHKEKLRLYYGKLNVKIPISSEGVIVGRSSKQSDYVLSGNINVSRRHAKVYFSAGEYYIHNYTPNNGTFVNGLRLKNEETKIIEKGDIIMLADEEFEVI